MRFPIHLALLLFSALTAGGHAAEILLAQESSSRPEVETDCLLLVLDQVELSARRDGILEQLYIRVGDDVEAGERVLQLEMTQSRANLEVARAKYEQAIIKAEDESSLMAAEVDLRRSRKEAELLKEVGQIPYLETFRAENTLRKDEVELELAKVIHEEDIRAARVSAAELNVAQIDLEQRTARAPVSGTIVKQYKHQGDWCEQGEPVVKILRMDKLMLQGIVNVRDIPPHRAMGLHCEALFDFQVGNPIRLDGLEIQRVSPEVDLDGNYLVWTFVENEKRIGSKDVPQWLLRPGISGTLKIQKTASGNLNAAATSKLERIAASQAN